MKFLTKIKSFFNKLEYEIVDTITCTLTWTDMDNKEDLIIYTLTENKFKHRKCKIEEQGLAKTYNMGKQHQYYITEISPWLEGNSIDLTNRNLIDTKKIQNRK